MAVYIIHMLNHVLFFFFMRIESTAHTQFYIIFIRFIEWSKANFPKHWHRIAIDEDVLALDHHIEVVDQTHSYLQPMLPFLLTPQRWEPSIRRRLKSRCPHVYPKE